MPVQAMLETYPEKPLIDLAALASGIEACYACAQSCTACAAACLGEPNLKELARCVRLNLDCAAVCATTGELLSRLTEPDWGVIQSQLEACSAACRACGEECGKHADAHEHCRLCAAACDRCEAACNHLRQAIPA